MIRIGILPAPLGRRRTNEERAAMGCTNRGHGREGIKVKQIDDQIKKLGNWLVDTFVSSFPRKNHGVSGSSEGQYF
jgi:hypothetical protein